MNVSRSVGFTLIESVIYLALCALTLVGIVSFMVQGLALVRKHTCEREDELALSSLMCLITRDVAHAPADRQAWTASGNGAIRWKADGGYGWYVREGAGGVSRLWRVQQGVVTAAADNCTLSATLDQQGPLVRFVDLKLTKGSARACRRMLVWEGFLACSS